MYDSKYLSIHNILYIYNGFYIYIFGFFIALIEINKMNIPMQMTIDWINF